MTHANLMQSLTASLLNCYTACGLVQLSDALCIMRDSDSWNALKRGDASLCGELVQLELRDWTLDAWLNNSGDHSDIGMAYGKVVEILEAKCQPHVF